MYLYTATIFKSTDKTDFATVGATAQSIESIVIASTTFVVEKTYAQFKALIVSPLLWSDVKFKGESVQTLYLVTDAPL